MSRRPLTSFSRKRGSLSLVPREFGNRGYDNCVNRCYYACFQAAVAALIQAGIRPATRDGAWGHRFVHSRFIGQLINRRKRYPEALRQMLPDMLVLRNTADYNEHAVTEREAARALRQAREFVDRVLEGPVTHG